MKPLTFSQTLNLKPVEIDGLNCFDTTQTKFIANHFKQGIKKDSIQSQLIKKQEGRILTLTTSIYNCENRVSNLRDQLEASKEITENERQISENEKAIHKEEKKRLKKNVFKVALIAVVEFVVLVLIVAAK